MNLITVLLSLVVACTAIDIVIFKGKLCTGDHAGFYDAQPNYCYEARDYTDGGWATGVYFVPFDWNIEARAYYWSQCHAGNTQDTKKIFGKWIRHHCMTGQPYRSAGYGFIGEQAMASGAENMTTGEEKRECVKPNMRGLADGTTYNLTAMGDELAGKFMMLKDATRATVPEVYKAFEMSTNYEL